MVFKWTITRPPFQSAANGVDVMHPGIATEFETGSIGEAFGIFDDNKTELGQMFGAEVISSASALALNIGEADDGKPARKPRGPNKPKIDASAPDPVVIPPGSASTAEVADDGIPEALRRTAAPAIAPPPPAAPPTGVLAGKVIAELEKRATGAADGGQALADWLATSGIIQAKSTYVQAIQALFLQTDEKLAPIATALKVE